MKKPVQIKLSAHETMVFSKFLNAKATELLEFRKYPESLNLCVLLEVFERLQEKLLLNRIKENNGLSFKMSEAYVVLQFFDFFFQNGYTEAEQNPSVTTAIAEICTQLEKAIEDATIIKMPVFDLKLDAETTTLIEIENTKTLPS